MSPPPLPEATPVSESTVEALLATILPTGDTATMVRSSPEPMSTPSRSQSRVAATADEDVEMTSHESRSTERATPPPPAASLSSSAVSLPSHVLDKCRSLLLPSIVQHAMRRNPNLDPKTAEKRALALLSGDKCAEFIRLAKRMRAELQGEQKRASVPPSDNSLPGSRAESKRPREEDSGSEQAKRQRLHSPDKLSDRHRTAEPVDAESPQSSMEGLDGHDSTSLPTRETTRTPETAVNMSRHRSQTTTPQRTSPAASDTPIPTSSGLLPGSVSIAHLSRATSLVSLHDHPPPGEMHSPLPTATGLSSARSVERAPSAGNDQPDTATSGPLPAMTPTRHSPFLTRPLAEHADTSTSTSADPSHHGTVTRPSSSPSNTPAAGLPAAQEAPENDMRADQDPERMPQQQLSATLVPALWAAVGGKSTSDVEEVSFFVDDAIAAAARHWARRTETFSFEHQHVKVHLLCLPAAAVAEVNESLPPDASREDIVAAMWNIKTEWPLKGRLVIQFSSDDTRGPYIPGEDSGPLEITQEIKSGENKLRLIQLEDMSSKLFVVHATYPSAEERTKTGKETIALNRTIANLKKSSKPFTHKSSVVA
ncbi:hypothetical protein FKP32DRAFT_1673991 [Trametes sanguinea]|nr:hypothetical protein FKP32DRAFT_1673991 [Trametes sanguinea]